tara:strand:- start:468 stop:800 length:333 start_codon:yes stop_codon:yes gene_type:complete
MSKNDNFDKLSKKLLHEGYVITEHANFTVDDVYEIDDMISHDDAIGILEQVLIKIRESDYYWDLLKNEVLDYSMGEPYGGGFHIDLPDKVTKIDRETGEKKVVKIKNWKK